MFAVHGVMAKRQKQQQAGLATGPKRRRNMGAAEEEVEAYVQDAQFAAALPAGAPDEGDGLDAAAAMEENAGGSRRDQMADLARRYENALF